jgi:hypothetical protein
MLVPYPVVEITTSTSEPLFYVDYAKMAMGHQRTDWLGYLFTPQTLKPWKKKIDAILRMDHPRNAMELCMVIGYVNYYHGMWPSRAHFLKLLTDQSG